MPFGLGSGGGGASCDSVDIMGADVFSCGVYLVLGHRVLLLHSPWQLLTLGTTDRWKCPYVILTTHHDGRSSQVTHPQSILDYVIPAPSHVVPVESFLSTQVRNPGTHVTCINPATY